MKLGQKKKIRNMELRAFCQTKTSQESSTERKIGVTHSPYLSGDLRMRTGLAGRGWLVSAV